MIYIYILVGGDSNHEISEFPYIGKNNSNWLIFFKGVENTNQYMYIYIYMYVCYVLGVAFLTSLQSLGSWMTSSSTIWMERSLSRAYFCAFWSIAMSSMDRLEHGLSASELVYIRGLLTVVENLVASGEADFTKNGLFFSHEGYSRWTMISG